MLTPFTQCSKYHPSSLSIWLFKGGPFKGQGHVALAALDERLGKTPLRWPLFSKSLADGRRLLISARVLYCSEMLYDADRHPDQTMKTPKIHVA